MQTVSNAWKSNQNKTIVSKSFVEVSLDIADPDALADASSHDNGSAYISDTVQVVSEVDKNIVPYSTLEQNLWLLDGSRKTLPTSDIGECGFVGDVLSANDGAFHDKTPVITIAFTQVHHNPIPGITITWSPIYGEYAEDFVVRAYDGDTLIVEEEVQGNKSTKSVVLMDIEEYDRITISIMRWCLPYHRARIEEIFVGVNKVYSNTHLLHYHHTQNVDPLSTSLPKTEVTFSIDNRDGSYNPSNPQGVTKYLMERQEVRTRYGYRTNENGIEWIKGGTFYLSEWDAKPNSMAAEFKARDLLEFMSEIFYEGVYNESGTSLYDLAIQLLNKANLPLSNDGTVKWVLDDCLKDIYTTAPLPTDTIANCLQLIANAGGCVFYQDRGGTLHIEKLKRLGSDYGINYRNSHSKPDIALSKPLKQVNVTTYHYFEDTKSSELYKGVLPLTGTSEIWIVYSDTAKTATASVTDGTLVSAEYFAHACKLIITAEGSVTVVVTGTVLKESKTDVIVSSGLNGEIVSLDNPMITSREMALAIGEWMEYYLRNRRNSSVSWRADPRIDALDIVSMQGEYAYSSMIMTNLSLDYNGGFKGTGEGRLIPSELNKFILDISSLS